MMQKFMTDPMFMQKMAAMMFQQGMQMYMPKSKSSGKSSSESDTEEDSSSGSKENEDKKDDEKKSDDAIPDVNGTPAERRRKREVEFDPEQAQQLIDGMSSENRKKLRRGERKMPLEAKIFTYYMKNFGCKDKETYKAFMKRVKPMMKEKDGGSGKGYEQEVMSEVIRIGTKMRKEKKPY